MSLAAGTRLGPYEVLALIGAGGMGEVYKARDTRLERTVAIKVLPEHLADDIERRARFEREAHTISGLNHPHICTLHDVGEQPSAGSGAPMLYLVMEHLTGETLAQRLRKGPLPLRKALTVAMEIADALAAAHRQGVIHRDLKPSNVMLTKTGAKLLDFGLAKLTGHGEQPVAEPLASALTGPEPLTSQGAIVGTLQYMAPEQLEGKAADARTDLWALGAILYEMVTGKRAFPGETQVSVMAAILEREPPPASAFQPLTPPAVDLLVRRCLAKTPDNRWDSAHDLADALRWMRETAGSAAIVEQPRPRRHLRTAALVAGGVVVGTLLGAGVASVIRPSAPPVLLTRPSLEVLPADELSAGGIQDLFLPTPGGSRTALAWTPDGQALVFVGRRASGRQLYIRRLDTGEAIPLKGSEGAQVPAVSADGRWVAFWANGTIRKVPVGGGPIMDLAAGIPEPPCGLAWDSLGRLFFGKVNGPIWVIPSDGAPSAVTTVSDAEVSHGLPWPLPGDRALLYTVRKRVWSWGDEEVVAHQLATGQRKTLVHDAADARYVPSGHLVFLRRGKLFAVAFDPDRLEVRGVPVPMLDMIAQALTAANAGDVTGAGQFAIATTGTLAWLSSPAVPYRDGALVTVDRDGQITPLPAPLRSYGRPLRLSPVGHRLAVTIYDLAAQGLWIYDIDRGTLAPLVRDGEVACPIWSPDGQHLVFGWLTGGRRSIAKQPADGSTPPEVIVAGPLCPTSIRPEGGEIAAVRGVDDLVLVTAENRTPRMRPLIEPATAKRSPELSPDGRWIAYESNVSGRFEIYVRPYAGAGQTRQASIEGGQSPAWHPTGRELFFVSGPDPAGRRRMMAATFAPGSPPHIGAPRPLFAFDPRELALACIPTRCYEVAPDGERFYAVRTPAPSPPPVVTHIKLAVNWLEELKQKVPVESSR